MTAVSPLKEGITIRIRVASKLSDGSDGPAFVAAEPTLPVSMPGVGTPAPVGLSVNYASLLSGVPVYPILARPLVLKTPMYLTLDGIIFKPYMAVSSARDDLDEPLLNWVAPLNTSSGTLVVTPAITYTGTGNSAFNLRWLTCVDFSLCPQLITLTDSGNLATPPIYDEIHQVFYKEGKDLPGGVPELQKIAISFRYAISYDSSNSMCSGNTC